MSEKAKPVTIYDNALQLDIFCADIIEGAMEFFGQNPKHTGNTPLKERVEFWVDEHLIPTIEAVVEESFESEDEEDVEM